MPREVQFGLWRQGVAMSRPSRLGVSFTKVRKDQLGEVLEVLEALVAVGQARLVGRSRFVA